MAVGGLAEDFDGMKLKNFQTIAYFTKRMAGL